MRIGTVDQRFDLTERRVVVHLNPPLPSGDTREVDVTEIHVHRVALHECQSCGHLMPTPAGQAKVERCVERGIQLFLGLLP